MKNIIFWLIMFLCFCILLCEGQNKTPKYDQWGERAPTPFVDTATSHLEYEAPNQIQVKDLHYTNKKYMDSLHIITMRNWDNYDVRKQVDQILKDIGLIGGYTGHKVWIEIKHDSKIVYKGVVDGWKKDNTKKEKEENKKIINNIKNKLK